MTLWRDKGVELGEDTQKNCQYALGERLTVRTDKLTSPQAYIPTPLETGISMTDSESSVAQARPTHIRSVA